MNCYDTHVHLDSNNYQDLDSSFSKLRSEIVQSGIEKVVLLHLDIQPWCWSELIKKVNDTPEVEAFININPNDPDYLDTLRSGIKSGYIGLKLHPRIHGYRVGSDRVENLVFEAGKLDVPVLIDAFPDGTFLMDGFDPLEYASLAKKCPKTRIIWAHMGGIKVLEFMLLAKRLPNVFLDTSYTLLYFRGSSVSRDLIYAMKSMRYSKIFYGSDYPDRCLEESLLMTIDQMEDAGMSEIDREKILYSNAKEFFGW